ncbi:LuxR family transcriptional regulator [Chitinophaga rhizophila]|uniref:LuxR C-terminal-related transcriptional regulator n=1 Tax=Chitinophaga rhizophila TaxID=2866212 RepID=A0ABS7G726_9BACT|nr:LuxR C-terminal-related transcriptional regulator [Chitinophaga rhizophila]MBW8683456.1 LuxR C-terminal-related transcriptional regulator [Chitinophaga rhizophila]
MLVLGTEMHIVTFIFVCLETIMFIFQLVFFLIRPEDKQRLWYLILLVLLLSYNIASGLLPDKNFSVPIHIQNMVAYGSGFCMASFFPFYFYKAFNLKKLKFHATYGVVIFLLVPYLVFFVISYSINKNLVWAREYGLVIPFFYSLTLIVAISRAIFPTYKDNKDIRSMPEIIGVYLAVFPWTSLAVVSYLDAPQAVEASLTNGGFLVITVLYITRTIKTLRADYLELQHQGLTKSQRIEDAADRFNLTEREKEIILMISSGLKFSQIAERLYLSERTVTTHASNIYKKVGVRNKLELLKKTNLTLPD